MELHAGTACSFEPVKSMQLPPVAAEENILYAPQTDNYEYPVEE